jgi:hypothetical protein
LPKNLIRDVSGQVSKLLHLGNFSVILKVKFSLKVVFEEEGVRVQPVDLDNAFRASGKEESQSALIKSASESLVSII